MTEETMIPYVPSFGSKESPFDKRTVTSDMMAKANPLKESGEIPLDFKQVDDLCDQQKVGICTKCTTRMMSEEYFRDGVRLSEYWGYLIGKTLIDDPMYGYHFEGSSIFTMLKGAYTYGVPTSAIEAQFPLQVYGSYQDFINDFKKTYGGKIPQGVLDDAVKHKIPGYYKLVDLLPTTIAREIQDGRLLGLRLAVGENTYTAADGRVSWAEKDVLPLRAPKRLEGGHAMAANSYKGLDENQVIGGPNSWSRRWGKNGYYYFVWKTQKGFFTEAWAIKDIPKEVIEEVKKDEFKVDLQQGMKHPDVIRLQKYLNLKGFPVASVGKPGSSGKETDYYGPATYNAVGKFQTAHGIATPGVAGFGRFGPKTRQVANMK